MATTAWIGAIFKMLFPYRTHLEAEVLYLRSQLARADRRIEEIEGKLTPIPAPHRPAPKLPTLKRAIDWTSFKDLQREESTHLEMTKANEQPAQTV